MSFWGKFGNWIAKGAAAVAIFALLLMTASVAANVIGRGFFAAPIMGMVEIVGLSGVCLIAFALGLTERDRAHITVMIMVSRLPQRLQLIFGVFGYFLSLVAVALLGWGGILQLVDAIIRPEMETPVLGVPKAPFVSIWVVGCVFLFGCLLESIDKELLKRKKK